MHNTILHKKENMPVPEEVQIQHVVEVFSCFVTPDVEKTSIWAEEQASSTDVIESVLESLKISTSAERFDLVEVYQDDGQFKLDEIDFRGRSRTLQEFESPARVQMEWKSRDYIQKNGACRLYIRPKTESLIGDNTPGLSVTWLDGLKVDQETDNWNFEPTYREPDEVDDLVELPVLNEDILIENIQKRFKRGRIYTYVGGILIAVNPFKYFPIYNPKYVLAYQHRKLGELPPHIFAVADVAYHRMLTDKVNQCIVISGESGSGKTENTKLILHHLTALSHKTQASVLERTILAAGPVLEAFGNAKTYFNNNSSRFGKFTELTYRADGVVCGAVLKKYLLEKSRIVAQAKAERNYHVFYYLLAGATQTEKELLSLGNPEDYFYLNQSQYDYVGLVDEGYELVRLQQAMRNIGFNGDVQQRIFSVLSAVLHIGNINFKKREGHEESVSIKDTSVVETVSSLLEVSKETLIEAFTKRRTVTRGEVFIRVYKHDEAVATRDAMAKALYGSLFDWIVLQINHILKMRHTNPVRDTKAHSIGVLDIFGFEDFAYNSFEQFCINFANENLQFYLNQHIFKIRQDEYIAEGLNWSLVDYADNSSCLDLISGKPIGLISLLDEECSLSYGTDDSLLDKFNKHHEDHTYYEKPSTKEPFFSIIHYAGNVKYQIKDFKAKNRDLMRHDIVTCLRNSKMLFLRELMGADPLAVLRWTILRHMVRAVSLLKKAGAARKSGVPFSQENPEFKWTLTQSPQSRRKILLQLNGGRGGKETRDVMRKATKILSRRSNQRQSQIRLRKGVEAKRKISGGMLEYSHRRSGLKSPPTVIAQFQSSLTELMETLSASHPYFVRCIRSNADKSPMQFDGDVVLRQLRYTGMLQTVKIRQAGYPCRLSIKDFLQDYHLLLPKGRLTEDHEIKDCLSQIGLDPVHFQVGRSKVFMRETQYRFLKEKLHARFDESAHLIQTWFRLRMARRDFLRLKGSALVIQAFWRGYVVRKDFEVLRCRHRAALRIQDAWRVYKQRKIDAQQKRAAIKIQKNARTYLAKKKYLKLKEDKLNEEKRRLREEQELKDVRDKAEALVEDALSKTIFNDQPRPYEEHLKSDLDNIDNQKATENETKETQSTEVISAGDKTTEENRVEEDSPKKDFSHHIYEKVHKVRTDSTISAASSGSSGNEQPPEGSESDNEKREEAKAKGKSLLRRLSFKEKKAQKAASRTRSADTRSLDDYVVVPPSAADNMSPVSEANKKKSLLRSLITRGPGKKGNAVSRTQGEKGEKGGKGLSSLFGSPFSSGGREWTPTDKYIVNGDEDMEILSQFLSKKVFDMNRSERAKKDTAVDVVFKKALQQYHANMLTTYASTQKRQEQIKLKYDDMTSSFEVILKRTIDSDKRGADFPVVIGIHAFNGVVDEFVKYRHQHIRRSSMKRPRKESRKEKKRPTELYQHNGHTFTFTSFNIATFCEHCNALIWDRGLVCQGCNFTCHKKCFQKLTCTCKGRKPSASGPHTLFGTELAEQVTMEEPIPFAIVILMKEIEDRGLLSEGIYRKPGLQASIKSLKNLLCTKPADEIELPDYGIHAVASVIKLFFRQLPSPLIPQDFYSEVLRSCDLEAEADIHASLYDVVQKFPKPNRELFEMVIIHLARIALNEGYNKMSPNGLAIIWAPCVMRPPSSTDAMEGLRQLPLQTKCVETLIKVQLEKIQQILSEHNVLGEAMETAENRMKQILGNLDDRPDGNNEETESTSEEFRLIQEQINSIEEERERLTSDLTSMEPRLNRGFTVDSDDGLTSDDALTDNEQRLTPEDMKGISKKLSASSSDISPSRGKRRKPAKQMRRWFSEKNLNDDSSFEDLSGDGNDDLYIIP